MNVENIFGEVKIRHVIYIYIIAMIISLISSILMVKVFNLNLNDSFMNTFILINEILIFMMLFYKLKISNNIIKTLAKDLKSKMNVKEIIFVVIIHIFIAMGASYIAMLLIYLISPTLALNFIFETPIIMHNRLDYITNILFLIIFSPIVEELIFRHVIFKRISEKFNIYIGIIVSAIIFASLNVGSGIIGALAFAIINSFLYIKYKNIFFPIVIHMINNLLAITILIPIYKYCNNMNCLVGKRIILNVAIAIVMLFVGVALFTIFIIKNKEYLDYSVHSNLKVNI